MILLFLAPDSRTPIIFYFLFSFIIVLPLYYCIRSFVHQHFEIINRKQNYYEIGTIYVCVWLNTGIIYFYYICMPDTVTHITRYFKEKLFFDSD